MTAIVRVAIIAVTIALFLGSALNAFTGQRDLAVLFALAAPLGISAWGFARGGHHEAALVLLSGVLAIVATLVLILNPRGVQDVAVTAYGGIVLTGRAPSVAACVLWTGDIRGDRGIDRVPHRHLRLVQHARRTAHHVGAVRRVPRDHGGVRHARSLQRRDRSWAAWVTPTARR